MKVIDPGHEYLLDSYDGGEPVRLVFVKREGEGYPFNVGHHSGTNCQEVIRALIDRVHYLQRQIQCNENLDVIVHMRAALILFEKRAAKRHWRELPDFLYREVEIQPTCAGCGHIGCDGRHKAHEAAATTPPSTRAKAAAEEIVAELDRRAWLFDSHGARPIASGKAAYMEQVVAAIIERCLAGGGENLE